MSPNTHEHFVVLPSNSCPKVHPDNIASKFIVSWENPFMLDENDWRVALTEMSYNFTPTAPNDGFAVLVDTLIKKQTWMSKGHVLVWNEKDGPALEGGEEFKQNPDYPPVLFEYVGVSYDRYGCILFSSRVKFEIMSNKVVEFGCVHGLSQKVDAGWYKLRGITRPNPTGRVDNISILYTFDPITITKTISIPKVVTKEKLIAEMQNDLKKVINSIHLNDEGLVSFKLNHDVEKMQMLHGFHQVLGFKSSVIARTKDIVTADYVPQLNRGIDHMYIYASCCAPTRVGDVEVPLLRNFFIEDNERKPFENPFGKSRNFIIRNPMYVPLSSTSINSIEVNIRDDAGRLINFDEGAKTSLTLHFKRTK